MRKAIIAIATATVLTASVVGGVATAHAEGDAKGDPKGNCATKTLRLKTKKSSPVHYSPSGSSSVFGHTKRRAYSFDHYCVNKHGKRWYQFKGGRLNNGWVYAKYVF